jgi:hypothetical protein
MKNQFALNLTLQERIKEIEVECLGLHQQITIMKFKISEDPMYVRALYSAFKKARKEHSFNEKKALSIKQNQVRFD